MKIHANKLLESRGGHTGNYSCPVHIPIDACKALFREVGIQPAPKAVGVLGDILENFAISILDGFNGSTISASELGNQLKKALGEVG